MVDLVDRLDIHGEKERLRERISVSKAVSVDRLPKSAVSITIPAMIDGINHITFSIADVERTIAFYRDVLGLSPIASWSNGAYFTAGSTWLAFKKEAHRGNKTPALYNHVAFNVPARDFDSLSGKILQSGAKIWQRNTTEGQSLYFFDPDGNKLEIHSSNLEQRIREMKEHPWEKIRFYSD